jgi:hypothetical protein
MDRRSGRATRGARGSHAPRAVVARSSSATRPRSSTPRSIWAGYVSPGLLGGIRSNCCDRSRPVDGPSAERAPRRGANWLASLPPASPRSPSCRGSTISRCGRCSASPWPSWSKSTRWPHTAVTDSDSGSSVVSDEEAHMTLIDSYESGELCEVNPPVLVGGV